MRTTKYCNNNSPNYATLLILIFFAGYGINWVRFNIFPVFVSGGGGKAYHAEAKNNIGALNRAQQAYFLEYQEFSEDPQKLGVAIKPQTENFSYSIRATKKAVFNYAIARSDAHRLRTEYFGPFWWNSKEPLKLRSYVAGVFSLPATSVDPTADKKEITTVTIVCETLLPSTTKPTEPTLQNGLPICGSDTRSLSRCRKN